MMSSEEINLIAKYRALARREKQCIRDFAQALGRKWETEPYEEPKFSLTDSTRRRMLINRYGRGYF